MPSGTAPDEVQRARCPTVRSRPANASSAPLNITADLALRDQPIPSRIQQLSSQRGGVIEGRRKGDAPSRPIHSQDDTPILVVAISVTDQGIQNQVLRKLVLRYQLFP